MSAIGAVHGIVDIGLVGLEILSRDQAAVLLEVGDHAVGDLTPVHGIHSVPGDQLQRAGVVALDQPITGAPRRPVVQENAGRGLGRLDLGEEWDDS